MARTNVVRISKFTTIADDLSAAISAFLKVSKSKNLSEHTMQYYSYRLAAFSRFLEKSEYSDAPAKVTPDVIREFLTYETEHNSSTTANHSHCALSTFFKFLNTEGYLEPNPMENVEKPRRRKTVINTFSLDQIDSMLSTCGKDFVGVRDRAMILLLIDSGLRASELSGLDLDDVNWAEQTVLVLGKGDKERTVPFGRTTREALARYFARRGELDTEAFFVSTLGGQIDRFRVRDIVEQRCRLAKISCQYCGFLVYEFAALCGI